MLARKHSLRRCLCVCAGYGDPDIRKNKSINGGSGRCQGGTDGLLLFTIVMPQASLQFTLFLLQVMHVLIPCYHHLIRPEFTYFVICLIYFICSFISTFAVTVAGSIDFFFSQVLISIHVIREIRLSCASLLLLGTNENFNFVFI